jgi:hypothetical protein
MPLLPESESFGAVDRGDEKRLSIASASFGSFPCKNRIFGECRTLLPIDGFFNRMILPLQSIALIKFSSNAPASRFKVLGPRNLPFSRLRKLEYRRVVLVIVVWKE